MGKDGKGRGWDAMTYRYRSLLFLVVVVGWMVGEEASEGRTFIDVFVSECQTQKKAIIVRISTGE
jgi:hypothetical protein